jgi:hypothetical protein
MAWQERDRPADLLWTGTSFGEFELWRERYSGGLTATEEAFAKAMSERAHRQRRRKRIAVTSIIAFLLVVLGVVGVSRQQAVSEARRAEAAKLLALAQLRFEEDPTEALAYTTASLELADTEEARLFMMRIRWETPPALELVPGGSNNSVPVFSPDGSRLAAAGYSEEVRVWTATGGNPPLVLSGHERSAQGTNVAHWASNELLVTSDGGFAAAPQGYVWRFPGGERVRTIDFGGPSFWEVGPETLLVETIEEDVHDRKVFRLRSWRLPDGDARELGRVDFSALGASMSVCGLLGTWGLDERLSAKRKRLALRQGPRRLLTAASRRRRSERPTPRSSPDRGRRHRAPREGFPASVLVRSGRRDPDLGFLSK